MSHGTGFLLPSEVETGGEGPRGNNPAHFQGRLLQPVQNVGYYDKEWQQVS